MNVGTATRSEVAINEVIRDAVSRTTGARTNVERAGDGHWLEVAEEWAVLCVTHGAITGSDSRREACLLGAHPEDFCGDCATIAAV